MSCKSDSNGQATDDEPVNDKNYEEIKIPVPWGHISGKWWGPKTKQPVLALHGWQDNCGTYDTLAPLLREKGISVLCIDLPGHGFSSHLPQGQFYYLFWDGVYYIRRIVKYFNWSKVTLMGHSLGGAISFLYAAIFNEEVDGYIAIDIAGPSVFPVEILQEIQPKGIDSIFKYENLPDDKHPRYDYNELVDLVYNAHKGSLTRKSAKIMVRRGSVLDKTRVNTYKLTRDPRLKVALLATFTSDLVLQYASRTTCKVLNIRAIPGYPFDSVLYEETLKGISVNGDLKVVRVLGTHHVHLNNPESILNDICNFLQK